VISPGLHQCQRQVDVIASKKWRRRRLLGAGAGLALAGWLLWGSPITWPWQIDPGKIAPLAMQGGDPYIRALMRTISASEANDASPYTIIYGGEHVRDLRRHPDTCVAIANGPNIGYCTTAAGRYQFLTTTWVEKAQRYHPQFNTGQSPDFSPVYQDQVVYAWLSDTQAWGVNIPKLLRDGQLDQVLRLLSGTWTSLGYGIESNVLTPSLKTVYQDMLAQERGW
jgi:muramidase (phage lysozyme)